jgi:3D (Asp-Asp-Asp) domain-containing protein
MRAGRFLVLIAVAALGLGLFSATALAGKKKKTAVVYFSNNPKFNKSGKVTAKGTLNTVSACKVARGIRLQELDATGTVVATLDGATSDSNGNWSVSGQLPSIVPAGSSVRVKVNKRTAGKFVCKAGVSAPVAVPAAA